MTGLILESHQSKCHDSFWVPKNMVGPSGLTWQLISMWKWVTPGGSAWLCWKSHQVHWRDWKGLDLKIIFAGFICRILLIIGPKRRKIETESGSDDGNGGVCGHEDLGLVGHRELPNPRGCDPHRIPQNMSSALSAVVWGAWEEPKPELTYKGPNETHRFG
jgi:hypothetical protein